MLKIPAVIHFAPEPGSVEIREISRPEPSAGEVLVQVKAVGVCGSDLHQWQGRHGWDVRYPVVLGHEFCGVVVEIPDPASPWREGERVVCETAAVIRPDSPMSRSGLYQLDPDRKGFGYDVNGAMTEFVSVPERCLHRVPRNLRNEYAALTEPCCVAYAAVIENSRVTPGSRVMILGPGPIGLLCASLARLSGADVGVVGLDEDRNRLDIAELIGCHAICGDPTEWCRQGDGLGVDGVIDATGVSASLKTALDQVRPAGWITKVGWGPEAMDFSLDPLVRKNVTLRGSFSHNWPIWERVLGLLGSGRLNLSPLLGGIWRLAEWQTAFEKMHSRQIPKAVLVPGG